MSSPDIGSEEQNTRKNRTKVSTNKRKRVEAVKIYKSAEFIEDSDLEDAEPKTSHISQNTKHNPPLKRQKVVVVNSQSNDKQKRKANSPQEDNDSLQDSDLEIEPLLDKADSSKSTKNLKNKPSSSKVKVTSNKPVNEKTVKPRSSGSELSKDEATIKRLKTLVTACGVRKTWAKVFEDCPKPSQQIRKLKEILDELGMTGRLSMEQAKKVKQKRELAQELADVQSFEQSVLNKASGRKSVTKSTKTKQSDSEDVRSEEDDRPIKLKAGALQSIIAFLEDQSDDD